MVRLVLGILKHRNHVEVEEDPYVHALKGPVASLDHFDLEDLVTLVDKHCLSLTLSGCQNRSFEMSSSLRGK